MDKILRVLSLSVVAVLMTFCTKAQYGNEWIDFSKTYYKFKVPKEGVCRINKTMLDAAGVPTSALGSDFALFRDGKEVPIYTTSAAGFGPDDYLAFFAPGNSGFADNDLYLSPEKQTNPESSLFNDSATYFLMIDRSGTHARLSSVFLGIPAVPPAPPAYCIGTVKDIRKSLFWGGKSTASAISPKDLLSAQFDLGEGYSIFAWGTTSGSVTISTPNLVQPGGVDAHLYSGCLAVSESTPHKLDVYINNIFKKEYAFGVSDNTQIDLTLPASELSTSNTIRLELIDPGLSERFAMTYYKLEYPRDWNFNGENFMRFKVPASANNQYLEIGNFNNGGVAPFLFDLTNKKVYKGDLSVSGKTRFYIEPSFDMQDMVLFAESPAAIQTPTFIKQVNFTNYSAAANQGDYVIITHPNLARDFSGKNYVDEYRKYRASLAGGSHAVVVAYVDELYDQFAYGNNLHPGSIKHFADFALNTWPTKSEHFFLIGKGVRYEKYGDFVNSPAAARYEGIVPTYGSPGSDAAFLMDKNTWKMRSAIGRLNARTPAHIATYLNKVIAYEAALRPAAFPTPATELWKKQVLLLGGSDASTPGLQSLWIKPTFSNASSILVKPKAGAMVSTIYKNTKGLPTTVEDKAVDSLVTNGLALITYYGHGSAAALDYNLKSPSEYHSMPKVPVFTAFGCDIAQIFSPTADSTIFENYLFSPDAGAIIGYASCNEGYTVLHTQYIPIMCARMANENYGQTIGQQFRAANDSLMGATAVTAATTSLSSVHMESLVLQGDPAVRMAMNAQKPDYFVETAGLSTVPSVVTTSVDSFAFHIKAYNLGMVSPDTVFVKLEHTNPSGVKSVYRIWGVQPFDGIYETSIMLPVDETKDLGVNHWTVTLDYDGRFEEISEANNAASTDVFIFSDNVVPVYPYNFSIVHKQGVELKASTLNPFKAMRRYRMEIDTTELFNSPQKRSTTIESKGGVIKWKPDLALSDSMVYYWRAALDSVIDGSYAWSGFSFIYLQNGSDGWNQSHYFQYKYNSFDSLNYSEKRKFSFFNVPIKVNVLNTVMELQPPYFTYSDATYNRVNWQGANIQRNDCDNSGTLQVIVFDSSSGAPWQNRFAAQGSNPTCGAANFQSFVFKLYSQTARDAARRFLDSIPDGNYVLVRNNLKFTTWNKSLVEDWQNDTLTFGSGVSLYHSLRRLGFDKIDSFNRMRVFVMMCQKGVSSFPIKQDFSKDTNEILDVTYEFSIQAQDGKMNSIVLGPAAEWKTLLWRTSAFFDTAFSKDSASVLVYGVDKAGAETFLFQGSEREKDLDAIDAKSYPQLRLQWRSMDSTFHTAPQLDYWRVLYKPLPEAALNPASLFAFNDSAAVGQTFRLQTALETLTELPMDSMLLRYRIIDRAGVSHSLGDYRYRNMAGNDTIQIGREFSADAYPGKNYLLVEANPDNDQPEQYHPNNIGYLPFVVQKDEHAPVMDVTFDGYHILDRDIVSAKPFIKVLLRDENKIVAVKDTSSMKIFLRYPSDPEGTMRRIPYDGSMCRFVPADLSNGKNEAEIHFKPELAEDGVYELYAKGQDGGGNEAGMGNMYRISFEVINKSTITNLLNYPNPFSTSTAFVFTMTGSELPTQFKIQILTVTGKVVREITKQEIGPIHIGRNMTEFRWDGKDQFGQTLGNGVYLYRFVTNINGTEMEHRISNADKFYKNGWSKMYIMR